MVICVRQIQTNKAIELQKIRQEKQLARTEAKKKQAEEKALAKASLAAEAASENPESKRRRIGTKITSQLTESDPAVLQGKFPNHQILVTDAFAPFLH